MTSECGLELHSYDLAHEPVHMLVHPCERTALLDCREYAAFIYLLYYKRYGKHCGRLHNLECLHQQGCHRWLREVIYSRTAIHRIEHAERHFKCMRHRQYREPSVLFRPLACMVACDYIGRKVSVAEHDALRASCCS